ncbi:MAG TPA: alpha-amylase family glycosyl hydrolase [Bacteroidota bacterium]|nr:alpha-amylase family glycosyl hydrolase [Bacteroidota bacterium]
MKKLIFSLAAVIVMAGGKSDIFSQTVPIKFRYLPAATYTRVHFPGTFNGWGPNSSGTIAQGAISQADSFETSTGMWVKTIPIAFGTHQYKIYRQLSATTSDWSWIPDPANRVVIAPDQNSQFVVDSLVLFQMMATPYQLGGAKMVVKSARPTLTAGIFQPAGAPSPSISMWIDGSEIQNASSYFDALQGILTYHMADALIDGMHLLKISVSAGTITKTDSLTFETRDRPIQLMSPSFTTRKSVLATTGLVTRPIDSVTITANGISRNIPVKNGTFTDATPLIEGRNVITVAGAGDADSVIVTRIVNHAPYARAVVISGGSTLRLNTSGSSDPDGEQLTKFSWHDDPSFPIGLEGKSGMTVTIPQPKNPGEYYYSLVVEDSAGHADTLRSYFTIRADGNYENPTLASNPSWAKQARVYFMFPKGITQTGTLNAAALKLAYVRDMGFNVVWLMPVMDNAYPIDNNIGPGYNITDFYHVAPEYGTNQDFKNFVTQAHALGLKVILDVTPNHSSRFHPWAEDARANKTKSPYWNWYQHQSIPHNTNGLGEAVDSDGFYYYGGFGNQLLNLNWTDVDMQWEMINVYKYWIREFGIDGYRFDVYWGPHRRYGEQYMGAPVREALKHIKPDILLLAEDDGTGPGTQTIYADVTTNGVTGGVDAAYDFKLFFNQIRSFGFTGTAVENLHREIMNGGYYPGPNSLYMRFMESQDEDRITYAYSSLGGVRFDAQTTFRRTMPMASVIFTVPGFPMIWNGQEIGYGYGISGSKENRTRTVINWNYEGGAALIPHYQRLAWIRGSFPAFTSQTLSRLSTGNSLVYGYTRPFENENAIVIENFSDTPLAAAIPLAASGADANVQFTGGAVDGKKYFLSDVYNDTTSAISFSGGSAALQVTMPAYGTAIYILSDSARHLSLPLVTEAEKLHSASVVPKEFRLEQNFPNPFNPSTTIQFQLPAQAKVTLIVYDVLGRAVARIIDAPMGAGLHSVQWNASGMPSGMYLYELRAGSAVGIKRMMVVK